jgi:hypothetical protein
MFCPRCSAENNLQQKYCRQCGLQLTSAWLALQGGVDEAPTKNKTGERLLVVGNILLILSVLAALTNILLASGPWNYGVIVNLLIGLIVSVPMITIGLARLRRARRGLQQRAERDQLASDDTPRRESLTETTYPTGRLFSSPALNSVTEGTTRHLTTPEPKR